MLNSINSAGKSPYFGTLIAVEKYDPNRVKASTLSELAENKAFARKHNITVSLWGDRDDVAVINSKSDDKATELQVMNLLTDGCKGCFARDMDNCAGLEIRHYDDRNVDVAEKLETDFNR